MQILTKALIALSIIPTAIILWLGGAAYLKRQKTNAIEVIKYLLGFTGTNTIEEGISEGLQYTDKSLMNVVDEVKVDTEGVKSTKEQKKDLARLYGTDEENVEVLEGDIAPEEIPEQVIVKEEEPGKDLISEATEDRETQIFQEETEVKKSPFERVRNFAKNHIVLAGTGYERKIGESYIPREDSQDEIDERKET